MGHSSKLQPVAKISKQQERNAARSHGDILRQSERQQQQLDELINYRDQYLKSFQAAAESGLSAVQMQDYRLFIKRLDSAIEQQKQSVVNSQSKCEVSQEEWTHKRSRSKMIDKIIEERKRNENKIKEKREQRELDDRVHKNITGRQ